jgi:hypothetical protein
MGNHLGSPIHVMKCDDRGEIVRVGAGTEAETEIVTNIVQTPDGGFAVLGGSTKT